MMEKTKMEINQEFENKFYYLKDLYEEEMRKYNEFLYKDKKNLESAYEKINECKRQIQCYKQAIEIVEKDMKEIEETLPALKKRLECEPPLEANELWDQLQKAYDAMMQNTYGKNTPSLSMSGDYPELP